MIRPVVQRPVSPPPLAATPPAAVSAPRGPGRFVLDSPRHAGPAERTESALLKLCDSVEQRRDRIDAAIERALRGREFSPAELLGLQARVFAYNQELEAVSRMVDKTIGAAKTTLGIQV